MPRSLERQGAVNDSYVELLYYIGSHSAITAFVYEIEAMSWTNEGTYWRRPLDCHDKLFQTISAAGSPLGREHWLTFGWLKLAFPPAVDAATQEQRLRDAWGTLRLQHPDVALTLHENEKRYVPVADDAALQEYVTATFHVETSARSVDELFPTFKLAPSDYATCHWVPASSELAIVSPHWRWDGRGHMMMLDALMKLVESPPPPSSRPAPASEAVNLVPTLDEVVGLSTEQVHTEKWLQKADHMLAPFTDGSPAIGLPITSALPQNTTRVEMVLPKTSTSAVIDACRSRGVRFTAALHASIVQLTQEYYSQQPEADAAARYKSWAAFDLRKQCPPPANGPAHAPSLRLVALPIITSPTEPWDTLATKFQDLYAQPSGPQSDLMSVRVPYVEKATSFLATAPPTTEPNLSNLGVVENVVQRSYGDIEVQDVALAVQMLAPQLYVHSWSWDGQARVSICYNESFYEKEFVNGWLEGLKRNLLVNLKVNDS